MISEALAKCAAFINEVEKLKVIYRKNSVIDKSRNENSAEHSWHIALMAIVLSEFANEKNLDTLKVVKMLLIHDIVEIDVGDTFLYDREANRTKEKDELAAARRIFGILPPPMGSELFDLWLEFEARLSPESKFAAALDSLQPLMNHLFTNNIKYRDHEVHTDDVLEKKKHIAEGSSLLWEYAKDTIRASEELGLYLK
jgi:putative hydrolases of HD superfamily